MDLNMLCKQCASEQTFINGQEFGSYRSGDLYDVKQYFDASIHNRDVSKMTDLQIKHYAVYNFSKALDQVRQDYEATKSLIKRRKLAVQEDRLVDSYQNKLNALAEYIEGLR